MNDINSSFNNTVIFKISHSVFSIILNRPSSINSLTTEMLRKIKEFLILSHENDECSAILLYGTGTKGFCAGGDVKFLAESARDKKYNEALNFLKLEYETDLLIHRYSKPVIAIADGITMGGGLGLSAGADIMIATERSAMAMPETRIGFFPDVGATGWMFAKCLEGYPEFLGLTGYTLKGHECVRAGLATHYIRNENITNILSVLENADLRKMSPGKSALKKILSLIAPFLVRDIPQNGDYDDRIRINFHNKHDLSSLMYDIAECRSLNAFCNETFIRMSQCSPTAMALTLMLLKANKGRPMEDVFANDLAAAQYMLRHHDFYEGVRARIITKDNYPAWEPDSIAKVDINFKL